MPPVIFADKTSIPSELLCALCKQPWLESNAVACNDCEEIFCRGCIESHLHKDVSCPACSIAFDMDAARRPPRQLKSMAERRIEVLCPFKVGCWRGPWGELASHVAGCEHDPARVKYAGEVDDELICEICHDPCTEPVVTTCCSQMYCGPCIRGSLQRDAACPHCRAETSEDLLQEAPKKVRSMLDAIPVLCSAACGWTGPRVEVKKHLDGCSAANVAAPPAPAAAAPAAAPEVAPAERTAPPAPPAPQPPLRTTTAAPAAAGDGDSAACAAGSSPADSHVRVSAQTLHPWIQASDAVTPFTAMAHIVAPAPTEAMAAKRKDLQISAVMDISGSMRGDKLRLAKESLKFVVEELQSTDRFGLIAFDDRVEQACEMRMMDAAGKANAASRITSLQDRGSTNLSGGLFAGIAQARDVPFTPVAETARTARAMRHPSARKHPVSATSSADAGFFGSVANFFRGGSPPPAAEATAAPLPPHHDPMAETVAPTVARVEAFKLVLKFNASPVKQNGKWLARYSFEVDGTLPDGVAHISVVHEKHGRLTLRPKATFGIMEDQEATFGVEVYSKTHKRHAVFRMPVKAEDGAGSCEFAVPAEEAPKPVVKREQARIVMIFTDGQANSGITDPAALTARTREILANVPEKDVTIFTFGFGANHNASLLQQLAEISQGSYYFVREAKQLKEIFADCIGGLLSMVASGIKLTVRPTLGVAVRRVMTQFPVQAQPDGTYIVSIKDLYAEEQRDVLVETEIAPRAVGTDGPVVRFDLACENVVLGVQETVTAVAAVPTRAEAYTGSPNDDVEQQLCRVQAAEAMADAQKLADDGEVAKANLALRSCRARVASSKVQSDYTAQLQRDLEEAEGATESRARWEASGQKRVSAMKACHGMQRSNCVEEDGGHDGLLRHVGEVGAASQGAGQLSSQS